MIAPKRELSARYLSAHRFLRSVVALVIAYGISMVLAGRAVAMSLFDMLGFGPKAHGVADEDGVQFSIFMFAVLGSVIVGWMVLMWFMVGLAADGDTTTRAVARHAVAASTGVWFLFDTGYSLATGEVEHAAFNVPFMTLLAGPLYIMMGSDNATKKSS